MGNVARMVVALTAVTGLSACLGSGGGGGGAGGGGGGGGGGSYQANYDDVSGRIPTSDMPTSLNANYTGQMELDVFGSEPDPIGTAYADLDIAVDWTDGQTDNPFSGTATNFTGSLVDGQTGEIAGSLSVDDSFGGAIARTSISTPVPGVGTVDADTGSGSFTMTGDLTVDGTEYATNVLLGGPFVGPGGEAMHGAAVGGVKEKGTGGQIFDGQAAGTFYLIKD